MIAKLRKSLEPWIPDSVAYYDHQIDGIRWGARHNSFILGDDMGLGKTIQSLTVFAIDVVRGYAEKMMVICPVSLKDNWADEIEKHTRFPYTILGHEIKPNGDVRQLDPKKRDEQILRFMCQTGPRILITNYEQVGIHLPALNALKFDVGVWDEAHLIKNNKAQRTEASMRLMCGRSLMLTGSPMLNRPDELWALLHKVDRARWPRYWTFRQRYCSFGGDGGKQFVGVKNQRELTGALQGVMLRRLKKDVLDLPEVQVIPRIVELHPEQRKLYRQVVDDLYLEVPAVPKSKPEIDNGLKKFLRLKQICGTTATILGPDSDHSYKLDLATSDDAELLDNGEKIVVFTQFRPVLEAYVNRMSKLRPDIPVFALHGGVSKSARVPLIKKWEKIEGASVLICMLQVGGLGYNLVAARHGSFLDKWFVPKLNQQAIDRLHRIGQDKTRPVQVREYRIKGTIETRIEEILRNKAALFSSLVDMSELKRELVKALLEEDD